MLHELTSAYAGSPVLFAGSAGVIGLVVGSFLNVVIYRLPLMLEREWRAQATELLRSADSAQTAAAAVTTTVTAAAVAPFNLIEPRSACPRCKTPIKARHNVPVLSWLLLGGRCAACGENISARYPAVEIATAFASAAVAWHFGFGAAAACALAVTWALIALTGIDIDHQLLPDGITLPLLWAGLLASVAIGRVAPRDAIIGAAAGYISLWLVFQAFRLLTGKEGMGYGDFKLFAALGAWLGWKPLPLVILLAAAAGAVLGILLIVLKGRDRSAPIPFGPYLAIAGWLALLYGNEMIGGYLRLSGLDR